MTGWQLIRDAPKDGTRILVSDGREVATSEFTGGRWLLSPRAWEGCGERGGMADLDFRPSHWMPLPDLPK
jgi:hypothetical protein